MACKMFKIIYKKIFCVNFRFLKDRIRKKYCFFCIFTYFFVTLHRND